MYEKQDREEKKKLFKLHGKPFIRLKLFPLATQAFTTCNQKKVNQKSNNTFLFKIQYQVGKTHQIWQIFF